ncbi:MAG: long-chain fatty acid--CoA ligase [Acidobacteriota bacterium]
MEYFDWTAAQANVRPDKAALINLADNRRVTYRELHERSGHLAGALQQHSVTKGDRVAILALNGPEFFELEFAGGKIGAITVPLNWRLTENELAWILGDCAPKVLVHDARFAEMAASLKERCGIDALLEIDIENQPCAYEQAIAASHSYKAVAQTHDDVTMIMYTSGTTGHPKGAMITHGMNFINCVNTGIPARITPDTVQLVVLPLFHTGGLNCYANPVLHAGGTVVLMREFDPGAALDLIDNAELGLTHLFAVPAPYQFMMQHPKFETTDFSRIVMAGVGGAPCAEAILRGWMSKGILMNQGWGMTETSPGGTGLDPSDAERKLGSAGKPVVHTEIKIVGDEGETLPRGEVGELLIRGPNVTPGYWNNEEATKNSFDGDWLKTGDAARFDEDGFLYIVDRWKDMYISGGENVYPAEVENVLYQLEQVAEAAIIGVPHERWGETGKAVLVLKPGAELDEHAVIAHCLENLAKFKVPETVEFIEALPRNATGKVLKRTLREQYVGSDAPAIS